MIVRHCFSLHNALAVLGYSAGVDYELIPQLWWRNEYRVLVSNNNIFRTNGENHFKDSDHFIVTSLSYSF